MRIALPWIIYIAFAPLWLLMIGCDRSSSSDDATATTQPQVSRPSLLPPKIVVIEPEADVLEIIETLEDAPSWARMGPPPSPERAELLTVCERIGKEYSIDEIEAAVSLFAERYSADLDNLSKVYVLNRVIFLVPEWLPLDKSVRYGGWAGTPVAHGEINALWPLSLEDNRLVLSGHLMGYAGAPYFALGEFQLFKEQYELRFPPPDAANP